jgi:hypothetical protein
LFSLHILQYRDASIGVGLDSAILGDKFPQITQNALPISAEWCRYDSASTTNSNSNSTTASTSASSGAAATVNTDTVTPQRLVRAHSRTASLSPTRHVRTRTGDQSFVAAAAAAASSTTVNIDIALPTNHLQEVRIAVQSDATLQDVLLALETSATQLGKLSVHDYTFCYTDDVSKSTAANDDALVLTALLTAELDRLSLMDGTLRILKEQLSGGSSSLSAIVTPGVEYTRWDRLGFVMDR